MSEDMRARVVGSSGRLRMAAATFTSKCSCPRRAGRSPGGRGSGRRLGWCGRGAASRRPPIGLPHDTPGAGVAAPAAVGGDAAPEASCGRATPGRREAPRSRRGWAMMIRSLINRSSGCPPAARNDPHRRVTGHAAQDRSAHFAAGRHHP